MQFFHLLVLSGVASGGVAGSRKLKHDHIAETLPPYEAPTIEAKPGTLPHVAQKLAQDAHQALSAKAPFKSQQGRFASQEGLHIEYEQLTSTNELDSAASSNQAAWPKITYGLTDVLSNAQMHWQVATEGIRSRTSEAVEMAKAQLPASDRPWPSRASTPHDILRRTGQDITAQLRFDNIDVLLEENPSEAARLISHGDDLAPQPRAGPVPGADAVETRSADPTPAPTISIVDARTAPVTSPVAARVTPDVTYHHAEHGHIRAEHPAPAPGLAAIKTAP